MKVIIFDLDGTLAESKSKITSDMAETLRDLLVVYDVAVISGGAWPQFESQLVNQLGLTSVLTKRLHLFPTSGTSFYSNPDGKKWTQVYCEDLTTEEVKKIMLAFKQVLANPGVSMPKRFWGDQIENRGTQITFSAMGQLAPVAEKKKWDPNFFKRLILIDQLRQLLPEFDLRAGGATSIDVTRKGIDKAHGISQIEKHLGFSKEEMLFIGDALFPGGNDYAVKATGVECIETTGPEHTIQIIEQLLA